MKIIFILLFIAIMLLGYFTYTKKLTKKDTNGGSLEPPKEPKKPSDKENAGDV